MMHMIGHCQQCNGSREMDRVVETRVANRTFDADGKAGDRKAHRGECAECGGVILRVSDEMLDDARETA